MPEQATTDVKTMSADEIVRLFETYGFQDEHGHSLVNCQDFIDLVERATGDMPYTAHSPA